MNPELRRNLWLEFSPHRLLAMPAVLALAFGVVAANSASWPQSVFVTATSLFVVLCVLWGARQAAESVSDEVRERTWDWQRLSSAAPGAMAHGKLFGATAFTWYGGAICVAAMLACMPFLPNRVDAAWTIAALVFGAVAMQGAALAGSLQAARKSSKAAQRSSIGGLVLLVGLVALATLRQDPAGGAVTWYGTAWRVPQFAAISACAFAGWAVVAARREMARELLVRQLPWAYAAFALFIAFYGAGFGDFSGVGVRSAFLIAGFLVSVGMTYYALFAENATALSLRRMVEHARGGRWRRAAESLPLWAVAFVLALAFGIAVSATPHRFEMGEAARWAGLYPIAIVLLAARDLGLLVFFLCAPRPRRVEGTVLLYMILLSWAIPLFLDAVGLDALAQLFSPFRMGGTAAAAVFAAHAAIVWGAAFRRWRRTGRLAVGGV